MASLASLPALTGGNYREVEERIIGMTLEEIEAIGKDPLAAARRIESLRRDLELVLVTLEERPDCAGNVLYNLRQRYPV